MQHKLTLIHGAVTLAAILLAEIVTLGVLAALGTEAWTTRVTLVTTFAALAGLLLGAWASRRVVHRLNRTLKISRACLRGNLSLRIADPTPDDLGLLAEQLDLLAEHIEQDEQDLDELREHNMRLTDQVRALAVVEERNRLARELHDSVKQHLFSLAMTASAIRTRLDALPDVPPELTEMVREVGDEYLSVEGGRTPQVEVRRPLPLLVMAAMRILDEGERGKLESRN